MRVAQDLYQNGYITYMRTDTTTLSETALTAARNQVRELYGAEYLPGRAPHLRPQGQERAGGPRGDPPGRRDVPHARRRCAGELRRRRAAPLRPDLEAHRRLADGRRPRPVGVGPPRRRRPPTGATPSSAASGRTITFPGYLRAYVEGADDPDAELDDRETPAARRSPRATRSPIPELEAKGHTTTPPARYTEASLVKRLEELGIGRPSTYASIMQTIQDRGYVWKKGTALVPTWTAFAVVKLLEQHFADLVDYAFTARMEDELDEIAGGQVEREPWLTRVLVRRRRRRATPTAGRRDRRARRPEGAGRAGQGAHRPGRDQRGPASCTTRRRGRSSSSPAASGPT